MHRSPTRVWFLTCPGGELLDVSGPWAVFGYANDVLGRAVYELELVTPSGGPLRTRHGIVIGASRRLPQRPSRYPEIVLVAGGSPRSAVPEPEAALAGWLRRHHARVGTLVSICTGAFVLGEAGLLDGRTCTTHWRFIDALRRRFPAAEVVDAGIFVRDGHVWTSAGITTGVDLALALVEADHGRDVAMAVTRQLVLFVRRSEAQVQVSEMLRRQEKEPDKLRNLSSYVLEHIAEKLPVERLASAVGMSPRSLSRWCRAQLGQSPADYVRSHRVDEVRRLLVDTALPLKDIAERSGLRDVSTLWRICKERLGVSPAEYRSRSISRPSITRLEPSTEPGRPRGSRDTG